MNGLDLLKAIREKNKSLSVIVMTAYGKKDLVIEAMRNRCDSFIEKPFSLDELILEIERVKINMIQNTNSHLLPETIPNLVHQINNPLMSIMGCAELSLLNMNDIEGLKTSMTSIVKATQKIKEINKKLLIFDKITRSKIEKLDICKILSDCLNMFKDLMALKGISVEKHTGSRHLYVLGEMFGLEQVFKNLILNAVDSMDDRSGKTLKVKAEMDKAASLIVISIEDTGCGIPEESINEIFNSYFTCKEHGTGLGLSVVESVLEKHKGEIRVESQVGKGTMFKVSLPTIQGSQKVKVSSPGS